MKRYLGVMYSKKNAVHRGGNENFVLWSRALELLPVAMYTRSTGVFDHMTRHLPTNKSFLD